MKAAFCTNIFKHQEIPEAVSKLKQIGYHGVEFWHDYIMSAGIEFIKELSEKNEIEVAQLCPYFNFTGTAEEYSTSIQIAEQYVEFAKITGCKNIRVFTGKVSSKDATNEQYSAAVSGLREICGLSRDINFVLETHDGSLTETSDATHRLLEDVQMKNLKVNLQIPLDYGREDVYESAEKLGRFTTHIHAHNWIGGWGNLTYLDSGDYDFKKFLNILRSKGFDGFISIEHGTHNNKRDPLEVAEHEIRYLLDLI